MVVAFILIAALSNGGDKEGQETSRTGSGPTTAAVQDGQPVRESNASAQISLGGSDITVWDNINPGNSVQVQVVYDMPTDAVPASIELHDSTFSDGVTVSVTP